MNYQITNVAMPDDKSHIAVIVISGEIDESNLSNFKKEFEPMLEKEGVKCIILEFSKLDFMNSSVIGTLAATHSALQEKGKKLMIAQANESVKDILELVGFTNLVECFGTLQAAIDSEGI